MKRIYGGFDMHITGAVCLLGLIGFIYFCAAKPIAIAAGRLTEVRAESDRLQQQLPMMERETDRLRLQLQMMKQQLKKRYPIEVPEEKSAVEVLSEMLAQRKLEMVSLRQSQRNQGAVQRIELRIGGVYADVVRFVDDLNRLELPTQIQSFSLSAADALGRECNVNLQIDIAEQLRLIKDISAGGDL